MRIRTLRAASRFVAALILAPLILLPGPALAHAFAAGSDSYDAFVEGAGSVFLYPEVLLPLIALALLTVLRDVDLLPRLLPWLLAGAGIAFLVGPMAGETVAPVSMGLGIVLAVIAALVPATLPRWSLGAAAVLTAAIALSSLLHGQDLTTLPLTLLLGVLFGAFLLPMTAGGAARLVMDGTAAWRPVVVRIAASWIAAVLVLLLAFVLRA